MEESFQQPDGPRGEPIDDGSATLTENTRTLGTVGDGLPASASLAMPESIGRYRLRRIIGEGGMGTVYEAEQRNPQRIVALKVIKAGVASPQALRRFELEGEALARLQHPGIAQIYESGAAEGPSGSLPYFAMEYVAGLPLLAYAARHRLDTRARLELMARICDAVHHAHQRGIIHRDLKPGNILVDASGQPKVLDFGVARFTDSDALATRQTNLGQLIGTLAYMSPEQALGNPLEIDIRSDVYTLGVILYELLAGKMPYQPRNGAIPEVVRTIREEEPTSLFTVNRAYRGDIATLCAKALEKDKSRRYASAAELAADLRRHLAHQPILAQPPTFTYQLGKFARRHRALVGGVAAVFLVLLAGVAVSLREASRARAAERAAVEQRDRASAAEKQTRAERDRAVTAEAQAEAGRTLAESQRRRADAESANAKAINEFLDRDLLGQASVREQSEPDPNLKVRTALDRAAAAIGGKFATQPDVEASLRLTIGKAYQRLTLYPEAQPHLDRALELRRKLFGRNDLRTIEAVEELGRLANGRENLQQAAALYKEVTDVRRRILGPEHPDTLRGAAGLSNAYDNLGAVTGDEVLRKRAFAMEREVYEIRRRVLGPEHSDTLESMSHVEVNDEAEGKIEEALALVREGLAAHQKIRGPDHPRTLIWEGNLADIYVRQGRIKEAQEIHERIVAVGRRIYSPGDASFLRSLVNLGAFYGNQGMLDRAEAAFREVAETARLRLGLAHSVTLTGYSGLGEAYRLQGKWAEAEKVYAILLDPKREKYGMKEYLSTLRTLAECRYQQGKWREAEADFHRALEIARTLLAPEDPDILAVMYQLANALRMQSRFAEAAPLLEGAVAVMRRKYKDDDGDRLEIEETLARLYCEQSRFAESERLAAEVLAVRRRGKPTAAILQTLALLATIHLQQAKFTEGEALARETVEAYRREKQDTWRLYEAETLLGASLAGEHRFEEAEPLLLEGYSGIEARKTSIPPADSNRLIHPAQALAQLYRSWGKPEKAVEWKGK
jgi:eukaryotic-like serine/threonine-protein kinase